MRLAWYINRLRSMSLPEVVHRLGEQSKRALSRRDKGGLARFDHHRLLPVFPRLVEQLGAATPELKVALSLAAQATLEGHFSALGRQWPQRDATALFPPTLWQLDPVTGQLWPGAERYTFDVDFRHDGTRGDIKYVWEFNRLQWLVPLAAHAVLRQDRAAFAAVETAIGSWHDANPPWTGVAWSSGIEVALRAISLLLVRDMLGTRLSPDTERRIGQILLASLFWLERFPSRFSSANNHLIAELCGEYLLGLALGQPVDQARAALIRECALQILPDGMPAEQSPSYGAFSAEMLLLCALAGREAGAPFPKTFLDRLGAFADWTAWLIPGLDRFGDDDEGRAMTLGEEPHYLCSVSAAISAFTGQAGLPTPPGDLRALLFGHSTTAADPVEGLRSFLDGGLSLWHGHMGGRTIAFSFDHGPLGYLSIAAHGHADALSIALSIDGTPVLVDPGTYLYGSGREWREWFRSTPAHNTLNIEGESQSISSGAFNWSHQANSKKTAGMPQANSRKTTGLPQENSQKTTGMPQENWWLNAEHDGYQSRFGVLHRRRVERLDHRIVLTDYLVGGERSAELVFQLAPGLDAVAEGQGVMVRRGQVPVLQLEFANGAITIQAGGDRGEGGWVSPRFGVKTPAPRIAWRGVVGPQGVRTLLRPLPAVPPAVP